MYFIIINFHCAQVSLITLCAFSCQMTWTKNQIIMLPAGTVGAAYTYTFVFSIFMFKNKRVELNFHITWSEFRIVWKENKQWICKCKQYPLFAILISMRVLEKRRNVPCVLSILSVFIENGFSFSFRNRKNKKYNTK